MASLCSFFEERDRRAERPHVFERSILAPGRDLVLREPIEDRLPFSPCCVSLLLPCIWTDKDVDSSG